MLLVNLNQDKNPKNPYFSNTLLSHLEENVTNSKKSILYINKRWDYSALICESCQHIYKCNNCDVSLNIHHYPEQMVCHLCLEKHKLPSKCSECRNDSLKKLWIWTQQVEKFLQKYFAEKKISIFRFDADVIKNKWDKEKALSNLHNADIIIGTKMITTGFDFTNVWLVCVMLLEQELLIPWYNTQEKVYSNIKQLLWRGWRQWEISETIIQTYVPENQIVLNITEKNYKDFFMETLAERQMFRYPPFNEMASLEYRHKSEEKSQAFMLKIKNKLDNLNNDKNYEIIITPNSFKKYNQYYFKIIIKGNNIRNFLENIKADIMKNSWLSLIFEY